MAGGCFMFTKVASEESKLRRDKGPVMPGWDLLHVNAVKNNIDHNIYNIYILILMFIYISSPSPGQWDTRMKDLATHHVYLAYWAVTP